ncbi:MAG: hypothetical protein PHE83_18745 [Opitutaceae bacterium]|nr:hypothetical protein [Opitutaceae bacterium]
MELLAEHVDWERSGNRVLLTEEAAAKLARHLELFPVRFASFARVKSADGAVRCVVAEASEKSRAGGSAEAPRAEKTALMEPAAPARLIVLPVRVLNPHILICRWPDAPAEDRARWVNVRVKSNLNFRPLPAETGEILARQVEGSLWEFAGNPNGRNNDVPRCPRWPGRW